MGVLWILGSNPTKAGEYLVTYETPKRRIRKVTTLFWDGYCWMKRRSPVAWAELPEPYTGPTVDKPHPFWEIIPARQLMQLKIDK